MARFLAHYLEDAAGGPTLVFQSGFESLDGFTQVGSPTLVSTHKRNGSFALKTTNDGTAPQYIRPPVWTASGNMVGRVYMGFEANPTSAVEFVHSFGAIGADSYFQFSLLTTGHLSAQFFGGSSTTNRQTASPLATGQFHLIEWKWVATSTALTFDWRVNEAAQTQATSTATASGTWTTVILGVANTADNGTVYLEDAAISTTAADYPLGGIPADSPAWPSGAVTPRAMALMGVG